LSSITSERVAARTVTLADPERDHHASMLLRAPVRPWSRPAVSVPYR